MAPKAWVESHDEATNEDVINLDHQLRSLTSLGEILYNERVHEAIPGHSSYLPSRNKEAGANLVRCISLLLVRGLREKVAFAVKMGRSVEHTAASSDTLNVDELVSLESSPAYPNFDSPDPDGTAASKDQASYSEEAIVSCSPGDVLKYIMEHCRQDGDDTTNSQREKIILFDVHVRNMLKLLCKVSEAVGEELNDAKDAFYYYASCMGIESWGARYRVSRTLRNHYFLDVPFDQFVQRPDPFCGRSRAKDDWPEETFECARNQRGALVRAFSTFAEIFTEERQYKESTEATQHWETRREIAQACYDRALDAIRNGRFDSHVAQFYHIALGQAIKDANDMFQQGLSDLNANKVDHEAATKQSLINYVKAAYHLFLGIGNLRVLLKTYGKSLQRYVSNGDDHNVRGPSIRCEDQSLTSTGDIRQDTLSQDGKNDTHVRNIYCDDNDNDLMPSQYQAWTTGYVEWLENSVKGVESVLHVFRFAKRHPPILKDVVEKIQIVFSDRPSPKMQPWESTIRDLYDDTDKASRDMRDDVITTLHGLVAKPQKNESCKVKPTKADLPLSFQSLDTEWHGSFRGTRHNESQFAIEYAKEVTTFTREPY